MNVNHNPVPLAPASYDYDDLKGGLDKAAKGAKGAYEENRDGALKSAGTAVNENSDPRHIPGTKFVDVENDFGGTEKIQVFDEKLASKIEDEATGAIPEGEARNNQAKTAAEAASKADNTRKE